MEIHEIHKCDVCGNIIKVVHAGAPALVCCSKPMRHLVENTVDAAKEKHVPVFERKEGLVTVKVGSVTHPMEEKHFIEWIEVIDGNKVLTHFLKPGEKPEATFNVSSGNIVVREYCNLHGLWRA
ncbi:MAG: desulfoferrodoxin [Candidatus Riflebacteria bacterium]|nr:desulfoferrodoxin [Candidatus Riflebacteria bacterium]